MSANPARLGVPPRSPCLHQRGLAGRQVSGSPIRKPPTPGVDVDRLGGRALRVGALHILVEKLAGFADTSRGSMTCHPPAKQAGAVSFVGGVDVDGGLEDARDRSRQSESFLNSWCLPPRVCPPTVTGPYGPRQLATVVKRLPAARCGDWPISQDHRLADGCQAIPPHWNAADRAGRAVRRH